MKFNSLLPAVLAGVFGLASGRATRDIEPRQSRPTSYPPNIFDQIIDHYPKSPRYEPHAKGTFKQRYFVDSTYYKPGGPVYLYIGGETSGESRFSNLETGIIQILMQETNGLGVILENRYYGQSYPFNTSTTDNLAYLTAEQSIADNAYFAQHAVFPGVSGNLTSPGTPWILYGGSLAGAQTAYSLVAHGDVLYAGIGSSATVVGRLEYPEWYDPIQRTGPQDCISSVNAIIEKIDRLVDTGNTQAIQELKAIFGLEKLSDIRDFAQSIAWPIGGPFNYPLGTWQELNWSELYSDDTFWDFCSNVTDINAPANITAVDHALAKYTNGQPWTNLGTYANYFKEAYLPLCLDGNIDSTHPGCFSTQNATYWADTTNSATRSYIYTTCIEQGAYQVAPAEYPSLILKVLQVDYTQQWCTWAFPKGKYNSIPPTPDLQRLNVYGGYNLAADRLALVDGDIDPWRDICVHSPKYAPPRQSTDLRPEYLIAGAGHHWDSAGILDVSAEPLFIQQAHLFEIRTVKKWLRKFTPNFGG
ncbi:putative extracellular serine carboxypeptidase [Lachnellula suecica]|uniref:Putative extracellular serine carboxypeptidase n=1 Tax=Lachnellula suecica TaxID=602035 RepID=A0A8T9C5N9_9HELO|nr:putative extracellular serine carboxypeptidase [Lachnellula suecica]